jgi:hypothetical protein
MQFSHLARMRFLAFGLGAAALGLTGCGTVDDALFGNQTPAPPPAAQTADTTATPADAGAPASAPDTNTTTTTTVTDTTTPAPPPVAAVTGISVPAVEPGSDTGTPVGQSVARLRGELSTLRDKVAADAQQFATLKTGSLQDVTTYQEAKSHIIIRLQVGTTKGNPELVSTWNTAQSALDTLTTNINGFAALGTDLSADVSRAHTERDTINDTFNMAGGVDEDHRQLTVLQQEANQLVGTLDGLQSDVTRNVQRHTAFVANERSNLGALENDIKNGELYASTGTAPAASQRSEAASGGPAQTVITIKFDHPKIEFEQDLYTALNQSLQSKPGASFQVVAVSPTGGSAAAMQKAQREAQHHAQDVLKSMTDMGVPAARVGISSSTDPAVTATEVRVFSK